MKTRIPTNLHGRNPFRATLTAFLLLLFAVCPAWSEAASAPAFYYTHKSSSTSDYIPEYDITLESNRYNVMQDFPAAGQLNMMDWASSHSWAESYIVAKTSGDRLFRLRGSGTGALEVREYDPNTLKTAGAYAYIGNADLFDYTSVIGVTISDNYVYWWNNGDGVESYNLATGKSAFVGPACRYIAASATHVFCLDITDDSGSISGGGDHIKFVEIDRETGSAKHDHGRWNFGSNGTTTQSWQFTADGAVVYATRPNGNNLELWKFDTAAYLGASNTITPIRLFSRSDLGGFPSNIDADSGIVMIPVYGGKVLLYDAVAGTFDSVTTALSASYPELLIQDVPEPGGQNPPPDPGGTTGDPTGDTSSSGGGGGGGGGGCFLGILSSSM